MEIEEIKLAFKIKDPVLALGPQNKNRLCFLKDDTAFLGPLHADLADPGDYVDFENGVKYFLRQRPKIIAYDLHPEYMSTKFAPSISTLYSLLSTPIQHHHAHIASCMAENGMPNQKVIGVAFDGAGLGTDNTLWGAEFLVCDYRGFARRAHLKAVPLLGGEQAIHEPWRLAAAWLDTIFNGRFLGLELDLVKKIKRRDWQILKKASGAGFNAPLASSMGRLFDAAASLILGKLKASSEAELAQELERLASGYPLSTIHYPLATAGYTFKFIKTAGGYIIDPAPLFQAIVADLTAKKPKSLSAYRFHLAAAGMIQKTCLLLRRKDKLNKVVLSGGVFQNKLLLRLTLDLLSKEKFQVFRHQHLSCSDSGLSLGQAVIAGMTY